MSQASADSRLFVFVVIAKRDVLFFEKTAAILQKLGYKSAFISFFQPGDRYLQEAGFTVYDSYAYRRKVNAIGPEAVKTRYGLSELKRWLLHEKLTFESHSMLELEQKFICCLQAHEKIILQIQNDYPEYKPVVIQELGGFTSVLSLFFAAQKLGIDHYFLEPALFRGRIHILQNTLLPLQVSAATTTHKDGSLAAVQQYIEKTKKAGALVVPIKDRHHFRPMNLGKLVNWENLQKIFGKFYYKFIKSQEQEYQYIWAHCRRFLTMWFAKLYNQHLYQHPRDEQFIYFPLHVPIDYSLTVRNPEYIDQISLLESICHIIPNHYRLYIKEHPAQIGSLHAFRLRDLLQRYEQIVLIRPETNNYQLLQKAAFVLTINSKSGAEALFFDQKVISLGAAFYTSLTHRVKVLDDLRKLLHAAAAPQPASPAAVQSFLAKVWEASYLTELYHLEQQNLDNFANSLLAATNKPGSFREHNGLALF